MANGLLGLIAQPQLANVGASFQSGRQSALANLASMQQAQMLQQQMQQQQQLAPIKMEQAQLGLEEGQLQLQQAQQQQRANLIKESIFDAVAGFGMPFEDRKRFFSTVAEKYAANPKLSQGFTKIAGMDEKAQNVELLKTMQAGAASGILPSAPKRKLSPPGQIAQDMGYTPGTPEFAKKVEEITAARNKGQSINITLEQKGKDALIDMVGKKEGDAIITDRGTALNAIETFQSTQEMRNLLSQKMITGFGAEFKIGLGKALQSIGVNYAKDEIANSEAFLASSARQVLNIIKSGLGTGNAVSDNDLKFAKAAAGGDISMTEESLRRIIDISERATASAIERYDNRIGALKEDVRQALPFRPSLSIDEDLRQRLTNIKWPGRTVPQQVPAVPQQQVPAVPQQAPAVPQQAPAVPQQAPAVPQQAPAVPQQQQEVLPGPIPEKEVAQGGEVAFQQHPVFGDITQAQIQQVASQTGETPDNVVNRLNQAVVIPNHPTFGNVTEEDIQATMKNHGVSREQVMQKMLQQMQQTGMTQQQMLQTIGVQ